MRKKQQYTSWHPTPRLRVMVASLIINALLSTVALAQSVPVALTEQMVAATTSFLTSLEPDQQQLAQFDFDDAERLNWHFIPRTRNGIPLKALSASQRSQAELLLQTFLGSKGLSKSEQIRGLENVLLAIETDGRFVRDAELYYITVFGTPSMTGTWALRYEGHHQALNWTFSGGAGLASTPQFFGSNPAEVREGPQMGLRVLAAEEDIARTLINSMTPEQRRVAILEGAAPNDIFTGAQKQVTALQPSGIGYEELTIEQQQQLVNLIAEVASTQSDQVAQERMAEIRQAGLEQLSFAWIGSTNRGDPHYYRIQGSGFLIEYDNTQNDANHVHLVWRDFDGDFGRDLIRLHYDAVAAEHGPGHQH